MISCANPKAQYLSHREAIHAAMERVLNSGWYILGEEVKQFEYEFAAYTGVEYAVGVGSGTEALHIALRAIGIGAGDEVITTAHTAVATAAAIDLCAAKPVFVDIEPTHFTIDPNAIESAITPKTRAVIAVHIYGHPCDMDAILDIAERYELPVIEDCAQAHGATYHGKRVGSMGAAGCFSFYPTKNLGAIGDGGAVVTSDAKLAKKIRLLREYGWEQRYISSNEGWNSRLDEIQAAILREKLKNLDLDNASRQRHAERYGEMMRSLPIDLPKVRPRATHVYHLYVIQIDQREALRQYLLDRGVQATIQYPVAIHQQGYYHNIVGDVSLPVTERAAGRILSLPTYPELDATVLEQVAGLIHQFAASS